MMHNLDKFLFCNKKKIFLGEKVSNKDSDTEISILSRWKQEQSVYQVKTESNQIRNQNNLLPPQKGEALAYNDDRFREDFIKIKQKIENNEIKKGVIYNSLKLKMDFNPELTNLYNSQQCDSHYAYGAWNNKSGFLGISPELLYLMKGSKGITYAIAGTDKEARFTQESIASEHHLVVRGITESFDEMGVNYSVGQKSDLSFHNYSHKLTPIEFEKPLSQRSDEILNMHPTPAISGYPKKSFEKIKDELAFENICSSKYYAGLYKVKSEKVHKTIVMIRNVFWENGIVEIHAGCGIVKNSILEKELEESHMKIRSVLEVVGIELI